MTLEEFKKLAKEHLFILEGYSLDKEGNKEMEIYGFDALFEQLTIPDVVDTVPDANDRECNCSNAQDRLNCGFECYNK